METSILPEELKIESKPNPFHTSFIEISEEALRHNINFLTELYGKEVIFSSVVKGNAYGHGIEVYIPLAEKCGVRHFSVFSTNEAKKVFEASTNPDTTILIMGSVGGADELVWAIENQVEFFVFEIDRLNMAGEIARKLGKDALVHIEVETGMNRTGFHEGELPLVSEVLKSNNYLKFKGLCTHFAGAESVANHVRIYSQKDRYLKMVDWFEAEGLKPEIKHTCCSAASVRLPEMRLDLVRIGILQYGFWPSPEVHIELFGKHGKAWPLRRLIEWKSWVMSVKEVKTGEFIGYGTTFLAQIDMKVAMVPVGYSHGFSRSMSNQGRALLQGQRVGVIGIVNMNCIALDVTKLDEVKVGEQVILIGKKGDNEVSVASFGELSSQLNYELLTRLPQDIPRKVV
ncbi:MAG: alanine racemase [Flammeovirgaceae bacterium]